MISSVNLLNKERLNDLPAVIVLCELDDKTISRIHTELVNSTIHCSHAYLKSVISIENNNWEIENFRFEDLKPVDDAGYLSIIDSHWSKKKFTKEYIDVIMDAIRIGIQYYDKHIRMLILHKGDIEDFKKRYTGDGVVFGTYKNSIIYF